jgi:hypothetical protein
MKTRLSQWFVRAAVGAAATLGVQALALAGDVSVSVNVNTPGLYGQINIGGDVPTPELIMPRPVVAVPVAVVAGAAPPPPMYLHVPPGYERHWARHCREYNACGRPVYFVSDRWYNEVYTPRYRDHHDEHWRHEEREHEMRREEMEHGHEHYDHGHDHDHGYDHDHGHDHDR